MATVGYARVSSVGQSLDVQIEKLQHCDKVFKEKRSWRNYSLHDERAGYAGDAIDDFRAIDQGFHHRQLVVGDGFKCYVRDKPSDFLTLFVLLALVDEAAGRAERRFLELVVGKSRR
jgi:hypothetical protein